MTTEEKAKAYDEALKKAQCWLNDPQTIQDCNYTIEDAIQNIFPKLRESEDERIRKKCITIISKWTTKEDRDECIAYLEKQKEQKPIDYPYLPGWRKNRDNNKPELKRSVLMLTTHGVAEGEWLGEKWCQYRWSCELKDGEVLYWIHLSDLERLEKEGEEKQKEQKPELVQQPPITYTYNSNASRDERLKAALLALLNSDLLKVKEGGYFTKQDLIEWAERIPTDKPAEWSDEDEKMRDRIIDILNRTFSVYSALGTSSTRPSCPTYKDEIAWLKSLRPSWKPSEEQMEALRKAVNKLAKTDVADSVRLSIIYDNLKKL